jgi:hypothetical protein
MLPVLDLITDSIPATFSAGGNRSCHQLYLHLQAVLALGGYHLVKDGVEAACHAPAGIMTLEFR